MSSRLVAVDDLVTVEEIAQRLRMSINTASNVVQDRGSKYKHKFPQPIAGRGARGVWVWSDVEDWYTLTCPKKTAARSAAVNNTPGTYKQPTWPQAV